MLLPRLLSLSRWLLLRPRLLLLNRLLPRQLSLHRWLLLLRLLLLVLPGLLLLKLRLLLLLRWVRLELLW